MTIGDGPWTSGRLWKKCTRAHGSNAAGATRRIILNAVSKNTQPKAKQALQEIWQAETKMLAEKAFDVFLETYEPKYPKATGCLQKDREELRAFYAFPARHWPRLRTTNPIESTFGTFRHRTTRTKGCLTRDSLLHMMFKLEQCVEKT